MSNDKHVDASISDLRARIGTLPPGDERARHLESLADELERTLGQPGGAAAPANLGERVAASILQFEGSHPRIATVLNELAEKLSDMGI